MARQRPLQAVKSAANQANYTASEARALIRELRDGFTIYMIRVKGNPNTPMDFLLGRCDELPIALKVEPKERK
jgi:hypothetical protein